MYSLALIIFVVSEKKAVEHFPMGSNVNLVSSIPCVTNFSYWYSIAFIWYLVYHVLLISLIGIL